MAAIGTIEVDHEVRITAPNRVISRIRRRLTFDNPELKKAEGLGLDTRRIPPRLFYWTGELDTQVTIPRGALRLAMRAMKESGVTPRWKPNVSKNHILPRPLSSLNVQLRPEYQVAAVDALLANQQGMVVLPCGAGKTTIGVTAVLRSGYAACVVVHTRELLTQWVERFVLIAGRRPRVITADASLEPLEPGEVSVAMVKTLHDAGDEADAFLKSVGALLVDEAQHVPAKMWSSVSQRCPARHRWGLTATPERSDGMDFLFDVLIGETVFSETARSLIDWGYLKRPLIVPIRTEWEPSLDHYKPTLVCHRCGKVQRPPDFKADVKIVKISRCRKCRGVVTEEMVQDRLTWSRAIAARGRNSDRAGLIALMMEIGIRRGRVGLCLASSNVAGEAILRALEDYSHVDACFVSSKTPKKERERAMDTLGQEGGYQALVATKLAEEGLDIPELDWVINEIGGKSGGNAKQRVGRAARLGGAVTPVVIEPIDNARTFERQWNQRRKAYVAEYGREAIFSDEPLSTFEGLEVIRMLSEEGCETKDSSGS